MDLENELSNNFRNKLDALGEIKHCMNCDHYTPMDDGTVLCDLARGAGQPPAKILIYACPGWSHEIPF